MKVIFLDHDGVICLADQWGKRQKNKTKFDPFDAGAIKALNTVLKSTGAVIVCSSDWRLYAPLEEMQELYSERGIVGDLIDYTEVYDIEPEEYGLYGKNAQASIRTREINDWVAKHKPDKWVAVDDLKLLVKNFILTPYPREGIKQTGVVEKMIKFLE
jgi:hypothetical protein